MDAPTGTVALMFSDIQGSTQLWETFGAAFEDVLSLHDGIIRGAIAEHRGYEVKTEGDAFMVAFGSADDAVAFCLDAQQRLHAAPWTDGVMAQPQCGDGADGHRGVRVRMGVHAGEPLARPDPVTGRMDYFGPMVNRAARVAAAGHGGQVLLSGAAWTLAASTILADGHAVTDLGEHKLRGLGRPEHLRQILPVALAARRFPPVRTDARAVGNLPARATSFVGRSEEIVAIRDVVDGGRRLVTLLGPGGTGKTSLALAFAEGHQPSLAGGAWFADASTATTTDALCGALATALDVPLTGGDVVEQLGNALRGRGRMLLVLDNLEQVADSAAAAVHAWLQRAPELLVLATSRRPLHVAGEQLLPIDPLPASAAVRLFVERAQEVKPAFTLSSATRADVEAIVADLDGLPLAIELAAARVRVLPPAAIRKRMTRRFDLLKGKRRGAPDRQATLRGAIEGSWELLDDEERSALAQCSVFEGAFTLEAAEAVLCLDGWPMDVVEALADHSLVRPCGDDDEPRFRLLRSIRAFARERLEDPASVEARHVAFFAELGQQLREDLDGPDGVEAGRRLAQHIDDVTVAAARAVGRGDRELAAAAARAVAAWRARVGPLAVGLTTVETVLALGVEGPTRAALLGDQARLMGPQATVDGVVVTLEEAVRLANEAAEVGLAADLQRDLAGALRRAGRGDEAAGKLEAALVVHRRLGDGRGAALDLLNRANIELSAGRLEEAERGYVQVLAGLKGSGDARSEGAARANLGMTMVRAGRLSEARSELRAALALLEASGDQGREATTRNVLGFLEMQTGDLVAAERELSRALKGARSLGNRRLEGRVLVNLGSAQRRRDRVWDARLSLSVALEVHAEVGNRRSLAMARSLFAEVLLDAEEFEEARESLTLALDELDALGLGVLRGHARVTLARVLSHLGQHGPAEDALATASQELADSPLDERLRLRAFEAACAWDRGDYPHAREVFGAALGLMTTEAVADPTVRAVLDGLSDRIAAR